MRGIWGILTLLMREEDGDNGNDGEKEASSTDNKDGGGAGCDMVMDQGN